MAILKMKRVEILGLLTESKQIIDYVQRKGCVEIEDISTEENAGSHFYTMPVGPTVSQFDKFRQMAESALNILQKAVPVKSSLLDNYAPRPDLTMTEYLEKSKDVDKTMTCVYSINSAQKDIEECKADIVRCETQIDQLRVWENLDIPTSSRGTKFTTVFIGSLPEERDRGQILEELAAADPNAEGEIEVVAADKLQTCIVGLCHKDNADAFEQALRSIGFTAVSEGSKLLPTERIAKLQEKIEADNAQIAGDEEKIKAAAEYRKDIEFLEDYFAMRVDKYQSLEKIMMDEHVFVLTGFIPEKYADKMKAVLEEKYGAAVSITSTDPDDESVPVEVEEKAYPATMESVTNMYSPPGRHDVDPNPLMSVFYFLLFGLMLGDAGYGLIMILVCAIAKIKNKHMEKSKAKTVNYGLFCGIGTTIWGALQNSWFGDLPKWISNGLHSNAPNDFFSVHHLYWFEPLAYNNITRFLMLCFFIGILHLFFAICIAIVKNFKDGNGFNGFVENFPFLLVLVGVLPVLNKFVAGDAFVDTKDTDPFNHTQFIYDFLTNHATPFYIMLVVAVVLIWLTPVFTGIHDRKPVKKIFSGFLSGLYGVYNAASGYLGDILSYARLLALGLCTGVIASVINQLGATPLGGNPVIFIIVFIIGHTVNIAINLIGAYVHTNRLQYVEFFSKFYEGGGTMFQPLKVNSKSFKFKEEN